MASKGKENSDSDCLKAGPLGHEESTDPTQQSEENSYHQVNKEVKNEDENSVLEIGQPGGSEKELESEILDALSEQAAISEKETQQHTIDEQLIANLGSGKNDYGVLESLIPQLDFDIIPLTQPKRVLAKSDPSTKGHTEEAEEKPESPPSRALKRKKKPASLLDSYFKGL